MDDISGIRIDDFDYPLTENLIAQHPPENRDSSRLLIVSGDEITEDNFSRLDHHIPETALLVFNNTRVVRARILFRKNTGSIIEIFCLEPLFPTKEISKAFQASSGVEWKVLVGNLKRWKSEILTITGETDGKTFGFSATLLKREPDGSATVKFEWQPASLDFATVLGLVGLTPLPPYIKRAPEKSDIDRYQTIFAMHDGSVAAPTAGLHFTPAIMDRLDEKKIPKLYLTLHVGAGTFRHVTAETIQGHIMHHERIIAGQETIKSLINNLDREIFAVGTTSARTLESLYWIGCKLVKDPSALPDEVPQWMPYQFSPENEIHPKEALEALLTYLQRHHLPAYEGETQLMIVPGYRFHLLSGIITNFHVPRSTLLLLVAALIGDSWRKAYQYAIDHHFRFLSYGDACLLFNQALKNPDQRGKFH
jgi:S-adenosylmethionine:tRNA ribosyltransferase-isomerase